MAIPTASFVDSSKSSHLICPRHAVLLGSLAILALATIDLATVAASSTLPDWSGQWEIVGATPGPTGGFEESLDQVLKEMQWSPPNKPEVQARVDQIVASEKKAYEAIQHGANAPATTTGPTCTFGFPTIMLDSPLMFEILPTPKETVLIFSGREVRHVYTDGRPHTGKDDLWPTPWGDSIGHWEGQTLVIDTIAVKSPFTIAGPDSIPIMAMGGIGQVVLITYLSSEAHFIERIRMVDKDHLENQMTVIDPHNLAAPWSLTRTYHRVPHVKRMIYEDCEGEDRNPLINGHYTLAPPPSSSAPQSSPAPNNASPAQSPTK